MGDDHAPGDGTPAQAARDALDRARDALDAARRRPGPRGRAGHPSAHPTGSGTDSHRALRAARADAVGRLELARAEVAALEAVVAELTRALDSDPGAGPDDGPDP